MWMRASLCFLLLANTLPAGELALEPDRKSPRARKLRKDGLKKWDQARPTLDLITPKEKPTPQQVTAAVAAIEEAVVLLEKSLHVEWDRAANQSLADAVRGWYALQPLLPATAEPADAQARKKADKLALREKRVNLRRARKFLLDYGKARKYGNQFRRCDRCDGRKDLRSPFGQKRPCPKCGRQGHLVIRKGIIESLWLFHSPLYRAEPGNYSKATRRLRQSAFKPESLAPFVRVITIRGKIENHDTWVRIHAQEKTADGPADKTIEKVDVTYVLYRVGKVWYLHDERYDRDVLKLPNPKKEDKES